MRESCLPHTQLSTQSEENYCQVLRASTLPTPAGHAFMHVYIPSPSAPSWRLTYREPFAEAFLRSFCHDHFIGGTCNIFLHSDFIFSTFPLLTSSFSPPPHRSIKQQEPFIQGSLGRFSHLHWYIWLSSGTIPWGKCSSRMRELVLYPDEHLAYPL